MESVSVIIPTYNREHTLRIVLNSYLEQEQVKELIFVIDGSTDNSKQYLSSIRNEKIKIRIIKNEERMGLPFSRNRGVSEAKCNLVFMGEDDVFLSQGTIVSLINVMRQKSADIAGGRVLYMSDNESFEDTLARYNSKLGYPVDFETLDVSFGNCFTQTLEVPFLQAIALIKKSVFDEVVYDTSFNGSAYREETDFYLRCRKYGKKIFWSPAQEVYNLPPSMCKNSGQRSIPPLTYELSAIKNNFKFLLRHYSYLKSEYGIKSSFSALQLHFMKQRFRRVSMSVRRRLHLQEASKYA
ncbi:MAG: glycosyltransferase family 2 protein [Bacteroidota bacterium]|nr:glycosyltransferase family 2 protein [Bacteroidota bacterium]